MVNFAEFSKQAYEQVKGGNQDKRNKRVNDNLKHTGFVIDKKNSNRDVQLYKNDKTGHAVISHRGSSFGSSKKGTIDAAADLMYTLGLEKHHKSFDKRAKKTDKIVKNLDPKYKLDVSAHSYGGASMNHTLIHKKAVRDRVNEAHLYNPLISPVTKAPSKQVIKDLDNKVTVHRTNNDIPSALYEHQPYGKIKTYKQKEHALGPVKLPKHLENTFDTLQQLKAHTLDNFVD